MSSLGGVEFACIVADPPWMFADKIGKRGAAANYDVMTVDDICDIELPPIADDAYLFMWRVSAQIEEAYRVVRAWGFAPTTEMVWRKLTATGKEWFGMGRTLRASHETCIVAKRGKPKPMNLSTRSIFSAPVGIHSEKPAEFFWIVESLAPGPRLELFARTVRPGWTCAGNQLPQPSTLMVKP